MRTLSDKFTGLARVMSGKYDWKPGQGGSLPSLCNAKRAPSAPICGKSSMAWLWPVRTAEPCSTSTVQICILSVSSWVDE